MVQSIALYGSELWWKGQKKHEHTIQHLFNRQARAITGMYRSTTLHPLLCEAGIIPASTCLDYRQRLYAHRLLSFPEQHPAKDILPVSLRKGDEGFQPGELPQDSLMWTQNARATSYRQWLAWQITIEHSVDPANGVEPVEVIKTGTCFEGKIIIENKKQALDEATKYRPGLVLWTDGSKLENGNTGAAVCWRDKRTNRWREKSVFLGRNKEVLDAELWAIMDALEIAIEGTSNTSDPPITIFSDSQKAFQEIQHPASHKNRFLRGQIYQKAKILQSIGHPIVCRWTPGHSDLKGNKKADLAAKSRTEKGGRQAERWSSIAYIKENLTQARCRETV